MRVISLVCFVSCVYSTFGYHHVPAPLDKHGNVVDTPEVVAAKHDHYATLSKAGGAVPHTSLSTYAHGYSHEHVPYEHHVYHGPPAPLNHDGTVADTPEVKHLKHEHLATVAHAFAHASHAHLDHHGYVVDTPAVQHARAKHLAAVAEAYAHAPKHYGHYDDDHKLWKRSIGGYSGYYHGPPAPLNHDGTVDETPEVKHAKAIHFAAHHEAIGHGYSHDSHPVQHHFSTHHEEHHNKYHGPPAPLNHDGTVAETPEVAHVKHERLAALAEAYAKAPHDVHHESTHSLWKRSAYVPEYGYHGPPAPLNHDGTVDDTPEVKHAKAVHFAAHHEARSHGYVHDSHPVQHHFSTHHEEHHEKYHGPPAPLNHDGTVAETPEVAHVKHERLAALAEAYAHAPHDEHYEHYEKPHGVWKRSAHDYRYHGPPAPLNHDGTVAETPEVQHVKHERLAALAEAFAKAPQGGDHYEHYDEGHERANHVSYTPHVPYVETHKYHGPPAPLNHDGTVAETPEVAHVKHERLAALAEAFAKAPQDHGYENEHKIWRRYASYEPVYSKYHGPPAPLNHDGTVAETPEVAHVKHERLAALAEAFAKAPHGHDDSYDHYEEPIHHNTYTPHEEVHKYHGPPAPLNHDGTVAETPEVKHVKHERLAALSEAYAKAPHDHGYEHDHKVWKRSATEYYHGPPAPLNHDGTVAETPEVTHVKHERLAALAEAFAKAPKGDYHEESYEHYSAPQHAPHVPHVETHKYHGPAAPLNHDGTVAETPEVKHLKSEHLAAHAKFSHAPHYASHDSWAQNEVSAPKHNTYHGPSAPLNHDGTVAETPEVKHVKSAHLAAVAEAFAKAPREHSSHGHSHW